jgi:hypothetical protein
MSDGPRKADCRDCLSSLIDWSDPAQVPIFLVDQFVCPNNHISDKFSRDAYYDEEEWHLALEMANGFIEENASQIGSEQYCKTLGSIRDIVLRAPMLPMARTIYNTIAYDIEDSPDGTCSRPWTKTIKVLRSLGARVSSILDDTDAETFKEMLATLSSDPVRSPLLGNLLYHSFSPRDALDILRMVDDYDPRGLEGKFFDDGDGRILKDWHINTPQWILDTSIEEFSAELRGLGIEPVEVFKMMNNDKSFELPNSREELIALLKDLKDNNGIEKFGRYPIGLLLAARNHTPDKTKSALILVARDDWSNALYAYSGFFKELAKHGYNIHLFEVGSVSEVEKRIKEAGADKTIDLLALLGHGSSSGVQLNSDFFATVFGYGYLGKSNPSFDYAKYFSHDAQAVIISCATGAEDDGFAAHIHDLGLYTFANKEIGYLEYCDYDSTGRISSCIFRKKGDRSAVTTRKFGRST